MSTILIFYKSLRRINKMYIAFRWLLGLTLAMWVAMCCIDIFIKKDTELTGEGFHIRPMTFGSIKNKTTPEKSKLKFHTEKYRRMRDKQSSMLCLHAFMFISGALVVSAYKKMNYIILITKREVTNVFNSEKAKQLQIYSKVTAIEFKDVATLISKKIWENIKNMAYKLKNAIYALQFKAVPKQRVNMLLLKKLKEVGEERKNLAQLLIAAIQENKNVRMQYQLENMAKNRLIRHIENTQKVMKENRSKYVSFQQLYLVTHQENIFLKSRLQKLTIEKDETAKNLLELINEIYKSKNNELKAYCSRFIVKTKDNLLNSDVGAEIKNFLKRKSRTGQNLKLPDPIIEVNATNSWLKCSSCTQVTDIMKGDCLVPLVSEAPKLKGLPGEYVWTVKDKDGLIEKLYEYDCESDLENGDTIRRIREYSVYFDKDCLLDFSSSSTIVNENRSTQSFSSNTSLATPVKNQGFLTGSEAFQKFMQENKNVVSTSILPITQLTD